MRKILLLILLSILSVEAYGQTQFPTRFLDIPIDGKKSEIFRKIKKKGFTQTQLGDETVLTGVFNGRDVYIDAVENRGKRVHRIVVSDKVSQNARGIRERFNKLYLQFNTNPKYISSKNNSFIPENEDIANEISNGKQYQAVFTKDHRKMRTALFGTLQEKKS